MIALYSFEGQEPTDLSFEKNEILDIIEKPQEEWWEARNALGNVGLVPGNYLVRIPFTFSRVRFFGATLMLNAISFLTIPLTTFIPSVF